MDRTLFPQYGRIAILDDKIDEVQGLIACLSQMAIPYVYLSMVPEEYETIETCFRVIFVDLVLVEGANDEKTIASMLYGNLSRLVKENNGPYVLAIWSTKMPQYRGAIEQIINELPCRPVSVIELDKSKYKEYSLDMINDLEIHINKAFADAKILKYVSTWENVVNQSVDRSIASVYSLLPDVRSDKAMVLAANLARLMLGDKWEKGLTNQQKMDASLEALALLLDKEIHNDLWAGAEILADLIEVKPAALISPKEIINTLLWISPAHTYPAPKNVYSHTESLTTFVESGFISSRDDVIPIKIDITHKCSYIRGGADAYHQFVLGVLCPISLNVKTNKYSYKLLEGFHYGERTYNLYIYLGQVDKIKEAEITESALFSVSDEVYNEIRNALGNVFTSTGKTEIK